MKFYSPLRYPGGKNRLAKFMALLCEKNEITRSSGHYVEPYAGGASVALFLLFNRYVSDITINDSDRSIYAFWYSIIHHTDEFISKIRYARINTNTWQKHRLIQKRKETVSLFELGFSTFFLNRTNISGIIDGGMIGGLKQKGKYKIDCRFNKQELIKRIQKIAEYKDRIHVYKLDALDLIKEIEKTASATTIFYFDPPYYLKGESLYFNAYKHDDHQQVSKKIACIKNAHWVISYDSAEEIKRFYKKYRSIEYPLLHTAHAAKMGREILFFSHNMIVPSVANPAKI
jgi:DNA adenine methylase